MQQKYIITACTILVSWMVILTGCSSQRTNPMTKAMMARYDRQPTYVQSAHFIERNYIEEGHKDYVKWGMEYSSIAMLAGDYDAAEYMLLKSYEDIRRHTDEDAEKAATVGNEGAKLFKGEPFERAMLCCYLGILNYIKGDYNNARIFFIQANLADATTNESMKEYRDDFRLAHWWLGRTFMKIGDEDNARIGMTKARARIPRKGEDKELAHLKQHQQKLRKERIKLEKESYRRAKKHDPPINGAVDVSESPSMHELPEYIYEQTAGHDNVVIKSAQSFEEFTSLDFQKQVNLILVIEIGHGPIKYLVGENNSRDTIIRFPYQERDVMVYIDGHKAGVAYELADLFHQADTRGMSEKDRIQATKSVARSIGRRLPYVGYLFGLWDVKADPRYWQLLPGEVHIYAAKVAAGTHTLRLECFDSNGYLLPRYSMTRYYMPVHDNDESVYLLHIYPEADNVYWADK